jgi:Fibronectin type III domain
MKFEILDGSMEYYITQLQPDTKYSVQVAALTRKGDGDRSNSQVMKTPGGKISY